MRKRGSALPHGLQLKRLVILADGRQACEQSLLQVRLARLAGVVRGQQPGQEVRSLRILNAQHLGSRAKTYDIYGVLFAGHRDMRGILTDYRFLWPR